MKEFNKELDYMVGRLAPGADREKPPQWGDNNYKTYSGSRLHAMGCPEADTLFTLNPIGLRSGQTYSIFEMENGGTRFFAEGTVEENQERDREQSDRDRYEADGVSDAFRMVEQQRASESESVRSLADMLREANRRADEATNRMLQAEKGLSDAQADFDRQSQIQELKFGFKEQLADLKSEVAQQNSGSGLGDMVSDYLPDILELMKTGIAAWLSKQGGQSPGLPAQNPGGQNGPAMGMSGAGGQQAGGFRMPEPVSMQKKAAPDLGVEQVPVEGAHNGSQ